ncbi:unnamed protein product [Malus baccata var. baccata]
MEFVPFTKIRTAHGLISICLITLLAFLAVDGRCLELAHLNGTEHQSVVDHFHGVVANVTVGGFNFQLNLSNPKLVEELNIKRSDFPSDFLFGAGTAAGQTEGPAKGGRGPSGWDHRMETLPGLHNLNKLSYLHNIFHLE